MSAVAPPAGCKNGWIAGVNDRFKLENEERGGPDETAPSDRDVMAAAPEARNFIDSVHRIDRAISGFARRRSAVAREEDKAVPKTRVRDFMKKELAIISPDETLQQAAQEMEATNCGILPVGTRDEIRGVITDRDIVLRAVARGRNGRFEKVKDYMTPEIYFVRPDDSWECAVAFMREKNINRVLVLTDDRKPCGILTFGSLLRKKKGTDEITAVVASAVGNRTAA
jgi:CBS domain-containing protein